jgi:4a-hydroxytetrahydrobiopterin dehydratase
MNKLDATHVRSLLQTMPGWTTSTAESITKTFDFDDYHQTIAFVNAVAEVAHQMDHHPELTVSYSRCVVSFSTHSVSGVTHNDIEAARRVDTLPSRPRV